MAAIKDSAPSECSGTTALVDRNHRPTLADHWNELASIALLGAERRSVPAAPNGNIETLLDHIEQSDPARRLLTQVAAMSAARRAGLRPNPAVPALRPAPVDSRAICPPAVVDRLGVLLAEWPELLEEFLELVDLHDWRLTPDSAVALMTRLRSQSELREQTEALTGPLAGWLIELFPAQLRASKPKAVKTATLTSRSTSPSTSAATPSTPAANSKRAVAPSGQAATLTAGHAGDEAPMPADIAELLTIGEPHLLAIELARRLQSGALANRNRSSLQTLIRRLDRSFLRPLAEALERAATNPQTMGLALSLVDFARFRLTMIEEFDR